jgi:CDP-glucose 4,6-dehydratase
MHFLITGHTGFKGAWLTLWLNSLGHKVSGISLNPLPGSLFEIAGISDLLNNDFRFDISNTKETNSCIRELAPEVVVHMAAQPLVRESYRNPRFTFETNVMGTLNVLEAVSETPSVKAQVIVTTDKVYKNINQLYGYKESDALGGEDPYSASKAMADLLAHSWIRSFKSPPTAIARAGNVIGGGDVSPDRLLPELIDAYSRGITPILRFPNAVRPWQHVLDCLNGYLLIIEALLFGKNVEEINIGPNTDNFVSVGETAKNVANLFNVEGKWDLDPKINPHESELLALNTDKARNLLNWSDKLKFDQALKWTVEWHKAIISGADANEISRIQINKFRSM